MNKSPLPRILLAILAIIAIWSLILCWTYFKRQKQLRQMQAEVTFFGSRQQLFQMLVNDAAQYASTNPAMDKLLRSIQVPVAAPATNPSATTRTPTR